MIKTGLRSLGERVSPHPSRLRRATFPGGEGCLPAGEHSSGPILNF